MPDNLWPTLSVHLVFNVTVANAGVTQIDPERLFRLQVCFSRDDVLDDLDDCFFLKDGMTEEKPMYEWTRPFFGGMKATISELEG